jgi:TRAP-type C4-dicarboxylate transport system permease small subunit
MFLNMMRPRRRRFFTIMNDMLMVVFGAMFLVAGWQFMQRAARFATPALGMPNLIFYLPAIIGMTLMLLVAIDRAVAALASGAKDDAAP